MRRLDQADERGEAGVGGPAVAHRLAMNRSRRSPDPHGKALEWFSQGPGPSKVTLHNRQRFVPLNLRWLRGFASLALPRCREQSVDGHFSRKQMEEVEIAIVSDRVIARVHAQFMGIPGATDVLTFEHGEILISAETAQRCAAEFRHAVEEEIALYTVHGLLHLNGFEDTLPPDAARMKRVQKRIWKTCLAQLPTP
ncbi:MAG: rRNA maturation RNase YbeY [Verrucomicrobiota bacterium]|nr:rRNA maturation RNase YbeY [Verrucomicrobiota bacterium]